MNFSKTLAGVFVIAAMLVPATSIQAQTYAVNYQTTSYASQQQLINQLLQVIAQLQAQIAAQGGGHVGGGVSSYGVDVETVSATVYSDDNASLFGNVRLGRAGTARVWFDYGTSQSFGEKSLVGTARSGSHYTFRADVTNLDEDERYYFRAVAEDPAGGRVYGSTETFETGDDFDDDDDFDDGEPEVTTDDAEDIDGDRAELNGEVDMNDFEDGTVFFVYGQDEDQVEDIEDEYETYSEIDEDGQDLQKIRVDTGLDDDESYSEEVTNLDEDEEYFFQICVEFENDDDDDEIICGGVEEFDTDEDGGNSNDEDPDVTTESAENIENDEAELHGEVDMNDFDDGIVFFVYGEDEDLVEEIEDEYDSYDEIDEDGDDLQKVLMDSSFDNSASFELDVSGLDEETEYFFQICVEYDDGDELIVCGGVEDFETED